MSFYIKQNDTSPPIRATLKDGDSVAIDLTGASVRFHMRSISGGAAVVDADATIINAAGGIVQYNWIADDTNTIGSYQAEFEVTYADSKIETFPNDGYVRIEVIDDIT